MIAATYSNKKTSLSSIASYHNLLRQSNPPARPTLPEKPLLQEQEQIESPGSAPSEHTAGVGEVPQLPASEHSKEPLVSKMCGD
jgi:hypothetical protein